MEHERSGRAPVSDRSSLSLRVAHSQFHDCAITQLRWAEDGTGRGALLLCLTSLGGSCAPLRQLVLDKTTRAASSPRVMRTSSVRGICHDVFGCRPGPAFAKPD